MDGVGLMANDSASDNAAGEILPMATCGIAENDEPRVRTDSLTSGKHERFRFFVLAAVTTFLIGMCVLLAVPFLPAITWGVALAIIAWPMHWWISWQIKRPVLASAISCAAVVLVILVPGIFVSYRLAKEAA